MGEVSHYNSECCGLPCPATTSSIPQEFFAKLAAEIVRPSYGDHQRQVIQSLLIRAEEAGIYSPQEQP